jgi:hypothetical protein
MLANDVRCRLLSRCFRFFRFAPCLALPFGVACVPANDGAGEGEGEDLSPCRTIVSDRVIETALELEDMDDVCVVEGNLTFSGSEISAISLPRLVRVDGGLAVDSVSLLTFSLPALETVGPTYIDGAVALTSIELPALVEVLPLPDFIGDFWVQNCPAITSVNVTSLKVVHGGFLIDAPALTSLAAPRLETTGDQLTIINTVDMEAVSLDALRNVADRLVIFANARLSSLAMPVLASVGGNITIGNNPELADCDGALIQGVGDCL